jgi:hypothetical protein
MGSWKKNNISKDKVECLRFSFSGGGVCAGLDVYRLLPEFFYIVSKKTS